MRNVRSQTKTGPRALAKVLFGALVLFLLVISALSQTTRQPQQQDGRPRRAQQQQQPSPSPSPTRKQNEAPTLGEPPPPPPSWRPSPTPTPNPEGQEVSDDERITIDTNLVSLNVRVIDRLNRPINDVRQEEFRVLEDGVVQPVEFFSKEEVPVSYGLAIDTSGSLRPQIDKVIEAGKIIIDSNKEGDETFLVRFVDQDKIETVQDFTADKTALSDALDSLYVEGGQTDIIDAVYLSADRIAQYKKGNEDDRRRRALILVTDGENRNSFYTQEQLFARLREADVQIYVIGFVNDLDREGSLIRKSPREKAMNFLERLAKETGGRAFYPSSVSELPGIAKEITRDLRTQFVISYNPTNKVKDGSFRSIRVTVADSPKGEKRIALTRSGRVAGPQGGNKPAPAAPKSPVTRTGNATAQPAQTTTGSRKTP
ncbi:MAG TPA: VWA domain-containing protein [Pyrinomonadaceae bacterium]|jgi:Ca-activated chloride channel family protein